MSKKSRKPKVEKIGTGLASMHLLRSKKMKRNGEPENDYDPANARILAIDSLQAKHTIEAVRNNDDLDSTVPHMRLPFQQMIFELSSPMETMIPGIVLLGCWIIEIVGEMKTYTIFIPSLAKTETRSNWTPGGTLIWTREGGQSSWEVNPSPKLIDDIGIRLDHEYVPDFLKVVAYEMWFLLILLESANVELVESSLQYPRGHIAQDNIRYEILVKPSKNRYKRRDDTQPANYSHRFEVRGNFAHHYETKPDGTENQLFTKWSMERPEKIIEREGRPCIRIWRPPYVKGPSDKPLVPKIRRVVA